MQQNQNVTWCTVHHSDVTGDGYIVGYGEYGIRWTSFTYTSKTLDQVEHMIWEMFPNAKGDLESCGVKTGFVISLLMSAK